MAAAVAAAAMAAATTTTMTTMTTRRRWNLFARRGARALLVGALALATARTQYTLYSTSTSTSTVLVPSWGGNSNSDGNSSSSSTASTEIRSVLQYASLPGADGMIQQLLGSVFGTPAPGHPTTVDDDTRRDDNGDGNGSNDNNDSNPMNGESFSACLLWMDDNFRLTEWVAYHYYMLKLRHIVVAVDPRSRTNPWDVLHKWKARMTVEVWTHDANFTDLNLTLTDGDSLKEKRRKHIRRQATFYQACAMHLKALNRTWTSFHDSDEFLVVTPQANVSQQSIAQRPGAVLRILQKYGRQQQQLLLQQQAARGVNVSSHAAQAERTNTSLSVAPAAIGNGTAREGGENSTLVVVARDWVQWFSAKPCMAIPRKLFSAVPSSHEDVTNQVPSVVPAHQFDTLKYRYQATPAAPSATDGIAKSLVDLARLPRNAVSASNGGSAHRPFKSDAICTHAYPPNGVLPLVIHHYLGSWEAFSYRDDVRKGGLRTREKWEERSALKAGGINDGARPWIRGFVKMVGNDAAVELLKDAGLPPGYRKSDNETREWASRSENR
jgi:Glycosyl transferase family 2